MNTYFKKCSASQNSIVDALKSVGVSNPSLTYRRRIGKINGISNVGSPSGNEKMLSLLKKGKLIKSVSSSSTTKASMPAKTSTTKSTAKEVDKFLKAMDEIHAFIKAHGSKFFYSFTKSETTFAKAKAKVNKGSKTGITCVVPTRWGVRAIGISSSGLYAKKGKFVGYNKELQKHLKKITSGGPIGKTIEKAATAGLLKKGDILSFENCTHTVTYTGKGCLVYDGGHAAQSRGYGKVGILLDYSKVSPWKNKKINQILRWI